MTSVSPADVLPHIPGWVDAMWEPLHGGTNNASYKLRNGERRAVLKIDTEPRVAPFNTRAEEAGIQRRAHEAGIAAAVLHVSDGVYLVEYIVGNVWTANDLQDPENLRRLAATLQQLHAQPLCGRVFDAVNAANKYFECITAPPREVAASCRAVIDEYRPPRQRSLCHNDLVAANIIATPKINLLDWEYACDNDPLFDLATVIEHHELDDDNATVLLEAYAGTDLKLYQDRLNGQRRLYLALLWLWLSSRDKCDKGTIDSVAARLVTSCS